MRAVVGKPLTAILADLAQKVGPVYSRRIDLHLIMSKYALTNALRPRPANPAGLAVLMLRLLMVETNLVAQQRYFGRPEQNRWFASILSPKRLNYLRI